MRTKGTYTAVLLASALAVFPTSASANSCSGADVPAAVSQDSATRATITCMINAQRTAHGLRALKVSGRLSSDAAAYSQRMVAERFFAHVDPRGGSIASRARASGYIGSAYLWALGENLAWGVGSRALPGEVISSWMASPGHRANVLDPTWTEIGIGVAKGNPLGGTAGATYVAEFGQRSGTTAKRHSHKAAARPRAHRKHVRH